MRPVVIAAAIVLTGCGVGFDAAPGSGGSAALGGGDGGVLGVGGNTSSGVGAAGGNTGASGGTSDTGAGGAGGGAGQGGDMPSGDAGCADGTREAYVDIVSEPNIAGCEGAFSIAGVTTAGSLQPACARAAGNDGTNPNGSGCSVSDLCAVGWHVCASASDVAQHAASGSCPAVPSPSLWITRQTQNTSIQCATGVTNNFLGCGSGIGSTEYTCAPLNRRMAVSWCDATSTWRCGSDGSNEGANVVKTGLGEGGVLCCRD